MIGEFPVEMKGLGCSDTFLKYSMPIRAMNCGHCSDDGKPNLFNCHLIHGYLPGACQRLVLALYEKEMGE